MRLLFRTDPLPGESPRGYLCRVAHEHGYSGPLAIAQIAGLPRSGLERDDNASQIAHVLRLDPEEWRSLCYRHVNGRTRYAQRLFCGDLISADELNYKRPRICPRCLCERPIWWAVWDLGLVTVCPIHRCHLVNQCPACKMNLAWQRPAVHECRCGLDLRTVAPQAAAVDLLAINAAIYKAAGLSLDAAAELDLSACSFPPGMLALRLGPLLRFILFVGATRQEDGLRRKQRPFASTNLIMAAEIDRSAAALLSDWPRRLREALRHMLPPESTHPAAQNFHAIFGNFYRHLFRVLPRGEFGFLHDAFERFVIEDWKGLIRGQCRYFSDAVRLNSAWVSIDEAERIARTGGGRILDAIHKGDLEATFVTVRRGGSQTEGWILRDSLNRWVTERDAELARYMPRSEAVSTLGLKNVTLVKVAASGVMRCVEGCERDFTPGFFFLREDVLRIKQAFEKHSVPFLDYSKSGELIALRHAMRNYLGRDSGLAAVIQAVIDGSLAPCGYTSRFRGITGYLFRSEDLRKYRPVLAGKTRPEAYLNFSETALALGTRTSIVRGLVAQGLLEVAVGYRNGFAKLVPERQARRLARTYVSVSALAKGFHLNSGSLARHLKESGTPLLAVSDPDHGRGHAFLLRKDVAARLQLPTREMLREAAQRRIEAARKRKWAEYKLTRETASERPVRRMRAHRGPSVEGETPAAM